jgi:hypothetical protein
MRGAVQPFVHCVEVGTPNKVYLGYFNRNTRSITLPPTGVIDASSTINIFNAGEKMRNQPVTFLPGFQPFVWDLDFYDQSLGWVLDTTQTFGIGIGYQCQTTINFNITVEGLTAPTGAQLLAMVAQLEIDLGLEPTRITASVDAAPLGTYGLYRYIVSVGDYVSAPVTKTQAVMELADRIRAGPANYWVELGKRVIPAFDAGDVRVAVNWPQTIFAPSNGILTEPPFVTDDQIAPYDPPVVVPAPVPSGTSTVVASAAVVLAVLVALIF